MRPNRLVFTFLITFTALILFLFMGNLDVWMVVILLVIILPMGFLSLWASKQANKAERRKSDDEK